MITDKTITEYFWEDRWAERWLGPFSTFELAVADARSELGQRIEPERPRSFLVAQGHPVDVARYIDAGWYLDRLEEQIQDDDCSAEDATFTVKEGGERVLESLLKAWVAAYVKPAWSDVDMTTAIEVLREIVEERSS